jgi:hypothetical protein
MKKAILLVVAVVTLVLALSGVALAASPQDIYNDYAADLKLDGTYTREELLAYLGDATLDQYGDPAILTALDGVARGILDAGQGGRDNFPFTGAQVALMALAVLALLGGGAGLRLLSRSRA